MEYVVLLYSKVLGVRFYLARLLVSMGGVLDGLESPCLVFFWLLLSLVPLNWSASSELSVEV